MTILNEKAKLYYIECVPYVCLTNPKTDKVVTRAVLQKTSDMVQFRLNNEKVWAEYYR